MPNQHEVRWSQLKVGVLVIVALAALTALISLMSGSSGGIFSRHIMVHSFFKNASGLKPGAPVNLQGVTIGSVKKIIIVPGRKADSSRSHHEPRPQLQGRAASGHHGVPCHRGRPGRHVCRPRQRSCHRPPLQNGDEVPTLESPSLADVIKSSQSTIAQVNVILAKVNTMADALGTSKGSLGKFINNPDLYNNAVGTLHQLQGTITTINKGQGTLGKLIKDDTLYNHLNDTVSRLQNIVDQIDAGKGTVGKLVKDPSLYNNVNRTAQNANQLIAQINQGKGTIGMMAKDEAFRNKVSLTVSDLHLMLERANAGEGTVGKLLHDPSLYNNSDQAVIEMRKLLQAFAPTRKNTWSFACTFFRAHNSRTRCSAFARPHARNIT